MSIEYAILGLLSWKDFSGYDLKKFFAGSAVMYWSGNNNQVYKALVQMHREGWISQTIQLQESLPARKIYSITETGRNELRDWLGSPVEVHDVRNPFLTRLAWADLLTDEELDHLITMYEEEIRVRIQMEDEQAARNSMTPHRSSRERYLWDMISRNVRLAYENELHWVQELKSGLAAAPKEYVDGPD